MAQAFLRTNRRRIRTKRAPEETLFFDTDFDRRALDAKFGLVYDSRNVAAQLLVETTAASEERRLTNGASLPPSEAAQKTSLLLQADYDEGIFGLRGSMRAAVFPRLSFALSGSSRIVRHDTHQANLDDRDEVYHQGEVGVQWHVSQYVQADMRLFGSWYHAVYLNAERSAENNVQRSLRLRPGVRWEPTRHTRVQLASEIRATYTVDDFVLPGRRPTDQSAREMRVEAEIDQALWQDTAFRVTGSYADLRLGRLLWDSFAEIPFDTLRTYNAWVHMETGRHLRADIGWRLYLRSDYNRAAVVRYTRVGTSGEVLRDSEGTCANRHNFATGAPLDSADGSYSSHHLAAAAVCIAPGCLGEHPASLSPALRGSSGTVRSAHPCIRAPGYPPAYSNGNTHCDLELVRNDADFGYHRRHWQRQKCRLPHIAVARRKPL